MFSDYDGISCLLCIKIPFIHSQINIPQEQGRRGGVSGEQEKEGQKNGEKNMGKYKDVEEEMWHEEKKRLKRRILK